jgi:hypothetical protein
MFPAVLIALGLGYFFTKLALDKHVQKKVDEATVTKQAVDHMAASADTTGAYIPNTAEAQAQVAAQTPDMAPLGSEQNPIKIQGALTNTKQGLWATRTVNGVQEWGTFSRPVKMFGTTLYAYVKVR